MMFDNDKYYSVVKIADDELELYDNIKYAIGETVLISKDIIKWDSRLYHPRLDYDEVAAKETFIIFERIQQKRKSPTRNNLLLRNHLYGVVKSDDPKIVYHDLTIDQIKKL